MGYVEINSRYRQATDDEITRPVRFACRLNKTTDIYTIYNTNRFFNISSFCVTEPNFCDGTYIDCLVQTRCYVTLRCCCVLLNNDRSTER